MTKRFNIFLVVFLIFALAFSAVGSELLRHYDLSAVKEKGFKGHEENETEVRASLEEKVNEYNRENNRIEGQTVVISEAREATKREEEKRIQEEQRQRELLAQQELLRQKEEERRLEKERHEALLKEQEEARLREEERKAEIARQEAVLQAQREAAIAEEEKKAEEEKMQALLKEQEEARLAEEERKAEIARQEELVRQKEAEELLEKERHDALLKEQEEARAKEEALRLEEEQKAEERRQQLEQECLEQEQLAQEQLEAEQTKEEIQTPSENPLVEETVSSKEETPSVKDEVSSEEVLPSRDETISQGTKTRDIHLSDAISEERLYSMLDSIEGDKAINSHFTESDDGTSSLTDEDMILSYNALKNSSKESFAKFIGVPLETSTSSKVDALINQYVNIKAEFVSLSSLMWYIQVDKSTLRIRYAFNDGEWTELPNTTNGVFTIPYTVDRDTIKLSVSLLDNNGNWSDIYTKEVSRKDIEKAKSKTDNMLKSFENVLKESGKDISLIQLPSSEI